MIKDHERYQDLYKKAWIAQNKLDYKANPNMTPKSFKDVSLSKRNGRNGAIAHQSTMKNRKLVERGLNVGMSPEQIASFTGIELEVVQMEIKNCVKQKEGQ